MDGPGNTPDARQRNLVARAPGPAGGARLTARRLGEPAEAYLHSVEKRVARLGDIVGRAHRAQLDLERVERLRQALPQGSGAGVAVVREPGTGYVLLGGEHRLAALRGRGQRDAEVYVLRSWRDFVAWMIQDGRYERALYSQAPWTVVDAAYLALKAVALLKPAREEMPYHDVAEFCHVHEGAMANVRWLIQLADNPDEPAAVRDYARQELQLIHKGEGGPHGVRDRVRKFRAALEAAAVPPMPVPKQRDMLGDIVARLAGITNGLNALGALNPGHNADDLAGWYDALGTANTEIIRLRTRIKEIQK